MLITGVDFETTGNDPEKSYITEVGIATWDTELHQPIRLTGYPVNPGVENLEWDPEVLEKFPDAPALLKYGIPDDKAARQFFIHLQAAEMLCAHNGNKFDKKFAKKWADRHNFEFPETLWIDTFTDLPLPRGYSRKLPYMPIDHRLYPNPFPHRAVFDVVSMFTVLDQYPLEKVLELARSPVMIVKALVGFNNNQLAKDRGYRAEYKNGKFVMWFREMKELNIPAEMEACEAAGFQIETIGFADR